MAVNNLKEKLEEKLQNSSNPSMQVIEEGGANIIPFSKSEQQVLSVIPDFVITLEEARQRISLLQEFVRDMMIPGQDYGIIPKCDKPSLFKPGAEKLCDIFGFSKQVDVINRIEDWSTGLFHYYEVKAILTNKRTGLIEAEGVGSCNSNEKKYSTHHVYSIANTILKMAKKRAFIDAVLSATRTSGLFSQDLEDLEDVEPKGFKGPKQTEKPEDVQMKPDGTLSNKKTVTQSQLKKIQSLVNDRNIPINKVRFLINERYKVVESKQLSLKQADDFIKFLISNKS